MTKRGIMVLAVVLTALLAPSVVFAGGKKDAASGGASKAKAVKVAFIMSGPISDMSWNYTGYQGLLLMEKEGAEFTYQENTEPSQIVESARTYAAEGYDMVFINDDNNQEDVVKTAADFPGTHFFICNGANHTANVYPVYFADEDQGYIMGVMAGLATKTNKIGFVGGIEFTPIIHCAMGFEQGAKSVNPNVEVIVTYTGSFIDVGAAKETAKALFEAGCDVVAPNADAASLGVIEAGEEAKKMTVACGAGMEKVGPTTNIGGVVMNTAVGYKTAFDQVLSGTLPSPAQGAQKFGIRDGLINKPDYNAQYKNFTGEMKAKVNEAFEAMASGRIAVKL
ncbi:MAG: BMP family protein [Treponema sp.]|jgi:basic membrane lipoprotein Med (substrate-binding protein (PBP1-ABC) superfamily)|nr:BMP family protein [Treponema sp.]